MVGPLSKIASAQSCYPASGSTTTDYIAFMPNRMADHHSPTAVQTLPDYRVRQSSRARHVNLTINPIDGLVVVVPRGFDERLIPGLIHAKRPWIEARLEQFVGGQKFAASQARLTRIILPAADEEWHIEYHASSSDKVRISTRGDRSLRVTGAVDVAGSVHPALRRWLHRLAQSLLPIRVAELAGKHSFSFTRVTIRNQRTRWGSCSSHGSISLNAKLMLISPELVEHVLLHELCHTIHPHHGSTFQALLAKLAPNHRQQHAALHSAWINLPTWAHNTPAR